MPTKHYIQRDILRKLSRSKTLTFTELKPDGLENGIFGYHLKQLIGRDFISKLGDRYSLTINGVKVVASLTRTNLDTVLLPKIFGLIVIENDVGEFIFHRRNAEPFLGKYTFPGGVLMFGDDIYSLIERQSLEKIGFVTPLAHKGLADLRLGESGDTLSHSSAHLFYGLMHGRPNINAKDSRFTPEWINPLNVDESELMPDVIALIDRLHAEKNFFYMDLKVD
ncbi:MAG: hypothetical protein WC733_09750 [Methylophilus sp.]